MNRHHPSVIGLGLALRRVSKVLPADLPDSASPTPAVVLSSSHPAALAPLVSPRQSHPRARLLLSPRARLFPAAAASALTASPEALSAVRVHQSLGLRSSRPARLPSR